MNAETSPRLPFNPDVLRWAREWRGRSVEEAAKKLNVEAAKVRAWEKGKAVPTVRQGRILADFYDRPFLEFFLSRQPDVRVSQLVPDFRLHRDAVDPQGDRELQAIQDWAEGMRHNAIDLYALLGEAPPSLPRGLFASVKTSPEFAAERVRAASNFPIEQQINRRSSERAQVPKQIRRAIEEMGVLVLKESRLKKFGVRGVTIFESPLPVIVFGTEAPAAQAFTLCHELGHVILQQSAISGPTSANEGITDVEKAERWCDEFAGAFLIPAKDLGVVWAKPNSPQPAIGEEHLRELANRFSVSRHAMLIRLCDLGYVERGFYWKIMRPKFQQEEQDFKGGGRPEYYGTRFRNASGDLYTGLVLQAWGQRRITNHNAAELMGTKSLNHLNDIRDHFYS